jgi:hypothetical protein
VYHLKHNSNFNSICKLTGNINITVLLNTSLPGYALLNASLTVANNFDAKNEHSCASQLATAGFCASGDSSSLAISVTLIAVSGGKLGESIKLGEQLMI